MADEIAEKVITAVLRMIAERRLKKQDIAAAMGIKPSSLSAMLRGSKSMGTDSIVRLANALGVPPSDLVCGKTPELIQEEPKKRKK